MLRLKEWVCLTPLNWHWPVTPKMRPIMKRLTYLCIIISLLLIMSACRSQPVETVTESLPPAVETAETAPPATKLPPAETTAQPETSPEPVETAPEPVETTEVPPETPAEPAATSVKIDVVQSVQENGYYCVPAVVQMALRHHGIEVDQTSLAQDMNTHPVTGTEYLDTAQVLNSYLFDKRNAAPGEPGYRVQTIAIGDTDPQIVADFEHRVKTNLADGYFVLAAIDVHLIYPEQKSGNHMLLITGYTTAPGSDQIVSYRAIDPSYVVQDPVHGGIKIIPAHELYDAIIYNEEPAYIW